MYDLLDTLHEGNDSRVYRAARRADGARFVVKRLRTEWPSQAELRRFSREFDLMQAAFGAGSPHALSLDVRDGVAQIVMESLPGTALDALLSPRLPVAEALAIARKLAAAVAALHARDVQHRDLNPSHVIVDRATGDVRLVDLGLATTSARSVVGSRPLSSIEGSAAYIAPEQTGRMNRAVDARADLYALGGTLYALFSGRPPFVCEDVLEYVHAHLARSPVDLAELAPDVPEAVCAIVMTLLAKRPEERYQSAAGVLLDLDRALDGATTHSGPLMLLGRGLAERPELPQDLLGREDELARLVGLFDDVVDGARGVALVSGEPGIGKTSLVFELHGPATVAGALVLEGKFDQLTRDVPFAALAQALGGFFTDALSESRDVADAWRERIDAAVTPNGRVLTDLVPAAAALLGQQAPVDELPPAESEQRLQETVRRVIRAIAVQGRAVVLFLDDLQWADLPSLRVLETLFRDPELRHLLLVGAWRDTEVGGSHVLMPTVEALASSGARVESLRLGPLPPADVERLLGRALHRAPDETRELAAVLHEKTRGNPFFLRRLVEELGELGALAFDREVLAWRWDLSSVRAHAVTDNVVTFVAEGLSRLSASARACLSAAAWIGPRFDLALLRRVSQLDVASLSSGLTEAVDRRMIAALDGDDWDDAVAHDRAFEFAFVHDRIQAAAGLLASPDETARTRLALARALDRGGDPADVFRVADHYGASLSLVDDAAERAHIADMHAEAGRRAMSSAAYAPADRLLDAAVALAGADLWERDPRGARGLHLLAARAAWLVGDLPKMHARVDELRARPGSAVDRLDAEWVLVQSQIARGDLQEAISGALDALEGVGISLPRHPTFDEVVGGIGSALATIGARTADELATLPLADDAVEDAARRLMLGIASASYIARPNLLPLLAVALVERTVRRGVSRESSFGFGVFALSLAAGWNLALAYGYGQLALRLLDRLPDARFEGRTGHVVNHFVRVWTEPVRTIYDESSDLVRTLMDVGDLEYAGWVLHMQSLHGYFSGVSLDAQLPALERAVAHMREHRQAPPHACTVCLLQLTRGLVGQAVDPTRLVGDDFDEGPALAQHKESGFRGAALVLSVCMLSARVIFRDYAGARDVARVALAYQDGAVAVNYQLALRILAAIADLSCLDGLDDDARRAVVEAVRARRVEVAAAAAQSAHNAGHLLSLYDAELAAVDGDFSAAISHYDDAMSSAAFGGFVHDEALAAERAALFQLARGWRRAAKAYLQEARFAWQRWGATAKVAQLDALHGELLRGPWSTRSPADPLDLDANVAAAQTLSSELDAELTAGSNPRVVSDWSSPLRANSEPIPSTPRGVAEGSMRPAAVESGSTTTMAELDLLSVMKTSQAISEALVLDELLQRLLRALLENAAAQRGFLILKGGAELVVEAVSGPAETRVVVHRAPLDARDDLAKSVVRYVERTREHVVLGDARVSSPFQGDAYLARARPKSLLCMPIIRQKRLVGVLYLENHLATNVFTEGRRRMLELLSVQAAISLENARLYDTLETRVQERTLQLEASLLGLENAQAALSAELADAATYVRSLLPAPVLTGRVRADWRYVPSAQLGGDALGYDALEDGRFAFYVVDVAGHGLASALLSISILTALHGRRLASADYGDPGSVLRALNDAFPSSTTGGRHFTMWYGVVDPAARTLTCGNGGHPSAVVCSADGAAREVGEVSVMLGVLPNVEFTVTTTTLRPDDTVFVFSDGAYEIETRSGRMLDHGAFVEQLSRAALEGAGQASRLLDFAIDLRGGPLEDDFTMLCLTFD